MLDHPWQAAEIEYVPICTDIPIHICRKGSFAECNPQYGDSTSVLRKGNNPISTEAWREGVAAAGRREGVVATGKTTPLPALPPP